jgi:SPP1 gp7 family putative phage head morphogenesis protein
MALIDDILDETVRHAHYLERHKASVIKKLVALMSNSNDEMYSMMYKQRIEKLKRRDLDKLLRRIKVHIKQGYEPVIETLDAEIRDLSAHETRWQKKIIDGLVPVELDWEAPSGEQIYAAAKARPFEGLFLQDWYNGLSDGHFRRVKQAVMQGYVEGQTTDEIVQQMQQFTQGRSRRAAETAARTALTHTSNVARNESYRRNRRVIRAVEWVATLDGRTTAVCRARDGKTWPVDEGPRPPAHPACRSTTIPVVKSLRELGIKADTKDIKTTRASMNGQVSSELNYDRWLRKQPKAFQEDVLGREKAKLFRAGLKMDRFVDEGGREFTLKEIEKREKAIWSQVYGKPKPTQKQKAQPQPQPDPAFDIRNNIDLGKMGVLTQKRGKQKPTFTIDQLNEKFRAQLSDQGANIVNKLSKPREIVIGQDAGVYYASAERLESGYQKNTITHEYGHHVDHVIRNTDGENRYFWSVKGLKSEWEKDRANLGVYRKARAEKDRKLREIKDELFVTEEVTTKTRNGFEFTRKRNVPKFDGANSLSDIVDSFVSGQFRKNYYVYGHTPAYWKNKDNGAVESFANMFAIQNSPEAKAWAQKNIPNLWAKFTAKMNEIENG